jgi:hypothetical protein
VERRSHAMALMLALESALVILVPEAEALVGSFRDLHDAGAAVGVPAHITVLYPFKPPDEIDEAVLERLCHLFSRFEPFNFALTTIRRVEILPRDTSLRRGVFDRRAPPDGRENSR